MSAHGDGNNPPLKQQRLALLIRRGTDLANAQLQHDAQHHLDAQLSPVTDAQAPPARSTRWTAQEDATLGELVAAHGRSDWRRVAQGLPGRDRKRCRERFINHVDPARQQADWSCGEDQQVIELHSELGGRWAQIAQRMSGRSPGDIKNRFMVLNSTASHDKARVQSAKWTAGESETLRVLVHKHGARNWLFIASQLVGRTDMQCMQHWHRVLNASIVKGKCTWTPEEDSVLLHKVAELGSDWAEVSLHHAMFCFVAHSNSEYVVQIARALPGRIPKQCRERYANHVDPSIRKVGDAAVEVCRLKQCQRRCRLSVFKDPWTSSEDQVLSQEYEKHASQWTKIAERLPGRTPNAIKNHWNAQSRRRHRPGEQEPA